MLFICSQVFKYYLSLILSYIAIVNKLQNNTEKSMRFIMQLQMQHDNFGLTLTIWTPNTIITLCLPSTMMLAGPWKKS